MAKDIFHDQLRRALEKDGVQLVLQTVGIKVVTFDEVTETIGSWEN